MTYSVLNLKFLKIVSSGRKFTFVPFRRPDSSTSDSKVKSPVENSAAFNLFSRTDSTLKKEESALTALVPTPFNPTDFLKARVSYFPPVFILETTSTTFPSGMPRPKSRTFTSLSLILTSMVFPAPITNSSIELSITSFSKI